MKKSYFFYIVYKTTCSINSKYYIGMHSCDSLDDGYLGSGKMLKRSIKKYGEDSFSRTILHIFSNHEDMCKMEAELVTEKTLNDPLCMNLTLGGFGGFSHLNDGSEDHISRTRSAAIKRNKNVSREDASAAGLKAAETKRRLGIKPPETFKYDWTGRTLSEEHRKNIGKATSIAQSGERNSQFGTCLVRNETESIRIKKEELQTYLLNGYVKGCTYPKTKGSIWVTNGENSRQIRPENLQEYIDKGYTRGGRMCDAPGTNCWVSNSESVKRIKVTELDHYISLGYVRGRSLKK